MKKRVLGWVVLWGLTAGLMFGQTNYYMDINGETAGFGIDDDDVVLWENTSAIWGTNTAGTTPTSTWVNDGDGLVNLPGFRFIVELGYDVTVAGIRRTTLGGNTNSNLTIQSDMPEVVRTITFAGGAGTLATSSSSSRGLFIGDNIQIVGDITINSGSSAPVGIGGVGPAYSGSITIASGSFNLNAGARHGTSTPFVMNGGTLVSNTSGFINIGNLSGSGGSFSRTSGGSGSTIRINQTVDGVWSGGTSQGGLGVAKSGSARLTINGSQMAQDGRFFVEQGALYLDTVIRSGAQSGVGAEILVSEGALLGGQAVFENQIFGTGNPNRGRRVTLEAATSHLEPGSYGQAGTMILEQGLRALNGGTFIFKMNDLDEFDDLLNSQLLVTGQSQLTDEYIELDGVLTVDIVNMGGGLIQAMTPYTLIAAPGITTDGFVIGSLPVGWEVGAEPFSVDDDELQITFTQIPEPALFGLILPVIGLLYLRYRRRH